MVFFQKKICAKSFNIMTQGSGSQTVARLRIPMLQGFKVDLVWQVLLLFLVHAFV